MTTTSYNAARSETHFLEGAGGRRYRVDVGLPFTYARRVDARYPVLYVLDGNGFFGAAVDIARMLTLSRLVYPPDLPLLAPMPPELIVVGIGYPGDDPVDLAIEWCRRRAYDFTSLAENLGEGERLKAPLKLMPPGGDLPYGGAANFLQFLIGPVRELVESRYRTDPAVRVLFGASSGGHFSAYALLTAPEAFSHFVIASPALYLCGEDLFEREAAYAATHRDMRTEVFLSAGSRELDLLAFSSIFSSMSRFAERLLLRAYPGLKVHTCIFQEETHARACIAALARSIDVMLAR